MRTRSSVVAELNAAGAVRADSAGPTAIANVSILIATPAGKTNTEIVRSLRNALEPCGVVMTSDFEDTRPRLADVVLVVDGWGDISLLRLSQHCQAHFSSPALLAILNESPCSIVEVLDSGFDYCLRWPISPLDVAALVRAVLRRLGKGSNGPAIELDPNRLRVSCQGVDAKLTKGQFAVLSELLRQPSCWLTSRELQMATGDGRRRSRETTQIRNHILGLRRKLGPEAWRIRWHRSLGYTFDTSLKNPDARHQHSNQTEKNGVRILKN